MTLTLDSQHARCDGCARKAISVDSPSFEEWETIEWQDGPDSHLCLGCQERREKGVRLGLDYFRECVRCGRNSEQNPEVKRWRTAPEPGGERTGPGPLGDRPRRVTVCLDCFDPDADAERA